MSTLNFTFTFCARTETKNKLQIAMSSVTFNGEVGNFIVVGLVYGLLFELYRLAINKAHK